MLNNQKSRPFSSYQTQRLANAKNKRSLSTNAPLIKNMTRPSSAGNTMNPETDSSFPSQESLIPASNMNQIMATGSSSGMQPSGAAGPANMIMTSNAGSSAASTNQILGGASYSSSQGPVLQKIVSAKPPTLVGLAQPIPNPANSSSQQSGLPRTSSLWKPEASLLAKTLQMTNSKSSLVGQPPPNSNTTAANSNSSVSPSLLNGGFGNPTFGATQQQQQQQQIMPSVAVGLNRPAPRTFLHKNSEAEEQETDEKPREVVVFQRKLEEKKENPERINLDRRNLTEMPLLEGETKVKLLNFQYNQISRIDNLNNLPNLIFLDLYNNQITEICNLDPVPSLRVLMLGRNRIKKIENLDALKKLDVLDFHSNLIEKIENINHLSNLRVLNLAGNKIKVVENVAGLKSLTEVNLRKNSIELVKELDQLEHLQRVFLSNNLLRKFEDFECITHMKHLVEISLEENPIAIHTLYRFRLMDKIGTNLKIIDGKQITDEERKLSTAQQKKAQNSSSGASSNRETNNNTALPSTDRDKSNPTPSNDTRSVNSENSDQTPSNPTTSAQGNDDDAVKEAKKEKKKEVISTMKQIWKTFIRKRSSTKHSGSSSNIHSNHDNDNDAIITSDFDEKSLKLLLDEIESQGFYNLEQKKLSIYGDLNVPLEKFASSVESITIQFVSFERFLSNSVPQNSIFNFPNSPNVSGNASNSYYSKMKKFTNLHTITFRYNHLSTLKDISKLSVFTNLRHLTIQHNPVCGCVNLFAPYILMELPFLETLNGKQISDLEKQYAEAVFRKRNLIIKEYASATATPNGVAGGASGTGSSAANANNSNAFINAPLPTPNSPNHDIASSYIKKVLSDAYIIDAKMKTIDGEWERVVKDIVRDTLTQLDNLEDFTQKVLDDLEIS